MTTRTYPHGVPCWVDTEQADTGAATAFYGGLFGWSFADAVPADAPGSYLVATLEGLDVAAVAPGEGAPAWTTYVAVDDADASAAAVERAGGTVVSAPQDAGPGGRTATCADPQGAVFRLWQARRRPGAQRVNAPGTWNFSNLHTPDPQAALAFYAEVLGWEPLPLGDDPAAGAMLRVPGYGDHLAATSDPGILERQAAVHAPPGFADVAAGLRVGPGPAHWHVVFAVEDRDAGAALARRLGATVESSTDSGWTKEALVRDPQGATFTLSQFTPPA